MWQDKPGGRFSLGGTGIDDKCAIRVCTSGAFICKEDIWELFGLFVEEAK